MVPDNDKPDTAMTRREALTTLTRLAAVSLVPAVGCTSKQTEASQKEASAEKVPKAHAQPAAELPKEVSMGDPVLNLDILPKGRPWPTVEPFLFCVHHDDDYPKANDAHGPAVSLAGRNLGNDFGRKDGWSMYHGRRVPGFPRHPHRGFETVTVVRSGLIDHADSLGAIARYGRGDVQWLTAGDGINHAEMFPLLSQTERNPIDFFQIWLNLPKKNKRVPPSFAMYWRDDIPKITLADQANRRTELTLVAGSYGTTKAPKPPQHSWASEATSDLAIWTFKMDAKARFTIPKTGAGVNRSLYLMRGEGLQIASRSVPNMRLIALDPTLDATLTNGNAPSELLMLQARPIGEPIARHGPFVMNTREEIMQAYQDYRRTGFGGWPWKDDAPVHGSEDKRFARRPDGSVEEAT